MSVNYAQCWEDSDLLRQALQVSSRDQVLSIASGGDNSLALLLDNPGSVTAIDRNPAQIYLCELKVAAMRALDYDDFVAFVGAVRGANRVRLYRALANLLPAPARQYWDRHTDLIKSGVIHIGRFEKYLAVLRGLLPLAVSRRTACKLLHAKTLEEQEDIFRSEWDGWRWRALFTLVVNRALLSRTARCEGAFSQVSRTDIAAELRSRTNYGLTDIPSRNNHFLWYILSGNYDLPNSGPSYLLPQHFYTIRARLDKLRVFAGDLQAHAACTAPGTYSAFNLSDVFEYLDGDQLHRLATSLMLTATPGARMVFWTMFTQPELSSVSPDLHSDTRFGGVVESDRGFFYGSFNLWKTHAPSAQLLRRATCAPKEVAP